MKVIVAKDVSRDCDAVFVEIEDDHGRSVKGTWKERGDGLYEITPEDREKERLVKLVEIYEWLFEVGSGIEKQDATLRDDGQIWVVYDVDGDVVSRGRDAEEAAYGAWDLFKNGGDA